MSENTTERDERLRAIRERVDAATEGPWEEASLCGKGLVVRPEGSPKRIALLGAATEQRWSDADFIAHAPEDVRHLLALLAERDAQVQRVRDVLDLADADEVLPFEEDDYNSGRAHAVHEVRAALDGGAS